jgi:hypothetical protein
MNTQSEASSQPISFDCADRRQLRLMRARYRRDRDFFTADERARLAFMRWLYRRGRLVP